MTGHSRLALAASLSLVLLAACSSSDSSDGGGAGSAGSAGSNAAGSAGTGGSAGASGGAAGSGGGSTSFKAGGACYKADQHSCIEMDASSPLLSTFKAGCKGTAQDACPTADIVGTCIHPGSASVPSTKDYYYAGGTVDAASAKQSCDSAGGTFGTN